MEVQFTESSQIIETDKDSFVQLDFSLPLEEANDEAIIKFEPEEFTFKN